MRNLKKILVISGSLRQSSTNLNLINAIIKLYRRRLDFSLYQGLSAIPPFNPDLDGRDPPANVSDFRSQLNEADGVLICTPEYAMGVPGTLKNAIDWTVSSMEFSHKPAALITASSSGQKAHQSLLETLRVIESDIPDSSHLLIPFAQTKVKNDVITDTDTLDGIKNIMDSLIKTVGKRDQRL
jgi:Predicted flavoprotein